MQILLAKVKRPVEARLTNPTGLAAQKALGCACVPLTKAARKRRKKIGSKAYLAWLDAKVPAFGRKVKKFFAQQASSIADELWTQVRAGKVLKITQAEIDRIVASIDFKDWVALVGILEPELLKAYMDNAKAGFDAIGFTPDESIVELVNEQAVAWASKRAGELVGMKRNADGDWVENPNKKWAITETTRDELRALVGDAIEEGWSADTFAAEIKDAHGFSEERSMTIARTELAFAHVEGNTTAWAESGLVTGKQSILGSEHDMDDLCNDNADEGVIPLDAEFSSGHQGPPYHPNCVCDVVPVLGDD